MNFLADVSREVERARAKHPAQNSTHGAYAVILEELDEVWDEVKQQTPDPVRLYKELVQTAAMCQRFAEEVLPLQQKRLKMQATEVPLLEYQQRVGLNPDSENDPDEVGN